MKKIIFLFLLFIAAAYPQNAQKIMVHFMPWYQAPPVSSGWGWHWTMNYYNPNTFVNGERQIASHFYPITGPYDSKDGLILEYQTLLMKVTGIDGVLVDWYGMQNFLDYGIINTNTQALFSAIVKADLLFGIVYEDQTIKHMIDGKVLTTSTAISHGKEVMKYLQNNWFNKSSYIKLDNRPLLMTFGPQYFKSSANWDSLFSVLPVKPYFYTLDNSLSPVATGAYPWPPMHMSVNGVLSENSLNIYLNSFYNKATSYKYLVTSIFPGFKDIYKQAGVGNSYGSLSSNEGNTFKNTLKKAADNSSDVIQVVTWNDYGEGTIIEPTNEFGYRYLEILQAYKDTTDESFIFEKADLQMPFRIYQQRLKHKSNSEVNKALDQVYNSIISGDRTSAAALLDSIETITGVNDEPVKHLEFRLNQNYPNPFNPSTSFVYRIPKFGLVTLKVYDSLGNEIAVIVNEEQPAGEYHADFNGEGLSSGIYYARLQSAGSQMIRKIVLLK